MQDAQVECFCMVATHLEPGGCLVIGSKSTRVWYGCCDGGTLRRSAGSGRVALLNCGLVLDSGLFERIATRLFKAATPFGSRSCGMRRSAPAAGGADGVEQ